MLRTAGVMIAVVASSCGGSSGGASGTVTAELTFTSENQVLAVNAVGKGPGKFKVIKQELGPQRRGEGGFELIQTCEGKEYTLARNMAATCEAQVRAKPFKTETSWRLITVVSFDGGPGKDEETWLRQ